MDSKIVMCFDFGTQKIGIAVGQAITKSANPIAIIKAKNGVPDWSVIKNLIAEWKPALLVVGLPLNMDGTESDMSRLSMKFARKLHGRFEVPYEMMDERLTSFEARSDGRIEREAIDDIAAKLILESYLRR
ncbi:MAG: Holliday junction resolvase RuvX [Pseudomonadales bacterium]|jgi:putative Holliday junction resolvase